MRLPAPALPAGRPATAGMPAETVQYLTFQLGGEVFATGILAVKEIIGYAAPTPVPTLPRAMRGVIDLRGAVVPVLDLQALLGMASAPVGRRTCIVIAEVRLADRQQVVGVVVDAVDAVLDIAPAQIEPPPAFHGRIRADGIQGLCKVDGRFVILLDLDRALAVDAAADPPALPAPAESAA